MKFKSSRINSVEPIFSAGPLQISIDCDMLFYDDLMCEIYEEIGKEAFMEIIKKYSLW